MFAVSRVRSGGGAAFRSGGGAAKILVVCFGINFVWKILKVRFVVCLYVSFFLSFSFLLVVCQETLYDCEVSNAKIWMMRNGRKVICDHYGPCPVT